MFLFFIFPTGGFEFEIYSLFSIRYFRSGWISHNFFRLLFCCGFQFQFDSLWDNRAEIIEWKIQFICILFKIFVTFFYFFEKVFSVTLSILMASVDVDGDCCGFIYFFQLSNLSRGKIFLSRRSLEWGTRAFWRFKNSRVSLPILTTLPVFSRVNQQRLLSLFGIPKHLMDEKKSVAFDKYRFKIPVLF